MHDLATIAADPERIAALPVERIPELMGACEELRSRLLAHLMTSARPAAPAPQDNPGRGPDRLLDVKQAAERLGVDVRWIYSRSDSLPFTRRIGPRKLRFSERALDKYIEKRRP